MATRGRRTSLEVCITPPESFRRLHAPGQFLILPNASDAGSARIIETCGAKAIATSSAAVAWIHGYPDGNALPPKVLVRAIELIVRAIKVPLSVDSEGGYSSDPAQVAENIRSFAEAGAAGVNLEDGTGGPDLLCAKIEAIRKSGSGVFINARVDTLLRKQGGVEETITRARRYIDAGCDGIFVPMLKEPDDIRTIAAAIDPVPLNVMAVPGLPHAAELQKLGARRLSAGASIARATNSLLKHMASAFLGNGDSGAIYEHIKESVNLNGLLQRD